MNEYFTREIEYSNGTLMIYQATIGDVGHVVWDAALALSKYMDRYFLTTETKTNFEDVWKHKRVVELGAGTGLVGMVAAMHGCDVVLTDLPELTSLMEKNIEENKSVTRGKVQADILKWGEDVNVELKEPDIVLVADCIYYDESLEPLVQTMRELCGNESCVFFSYEERTTEQKIMLQQKFFKLVGQYFDLHKIPTDVQDPLYSSDDIHLFKMTLKKS